MVLCLAFITFLKQTAFWIAMVNMENVVILGTGISGCTAAIYTARANLKPLVISGPEDGGQLTLTTDVENFPGFEHGVMGPELVSNSKKQAERFGARFKVDIASAFRVIVGGYELELISGEKVQCRSLIISTGASARWLGIASEDKFKGRGVSSCATCDGAFYKGKKVLVVGGGDSAMEESMFLTKFADSVVVVHRRDAFIASKIMQERFFSNTKCSVLWNKTIVEFVGDKVLKGVVLEDTVTKARMSVDCDGVFLAIGHIPNTSIFRGQLQLDKLGYLITDRNMHTALPGVFACGDVQDTRYRQAVTAAGTGCVAALEAERYLAEKGIH